MDGLTRWNAARTSAALLGSTASPLRSFNIKLQDRVNQLSKEVLGEPLDPNYRPPSAYNDGELFGMEYLYSETGNELPGVSPLSVIEKEIEMGMNDVDDDDDIYGMRGKEPSAAEEVDPELEFAFNAFAADASESGSAESEDEQAACDWRGAPGWHEVVQLASFLVDKASLAITDSQAEAIIKLYNGITDYDKTPLTFKTQLNPTTGRYSREKEGSSGTSHTGVVEMRRSFLTAGFASHSPSKSRLVEAICTILSIQITSPDKHPHYVSTNAKILRKYNTIKSGIMECPKIVEATRMALFQINETTLSRW